MIFCIFLKKTSTFILQNNTSFHYYKLFSFFVFTFFSKHQFKFPNSSNIYHIKYTLCSNGHRNTISKNSSKCNETNNTTFKKLLSREFCKKNFVLHKIAFFELLCVFSTKKKFEIFDWKKREILKIKKGNLEWKKKLKFLHYFAQNVV